MTLDPVVAGDPHVPAHNSERDAINALQQGLDTKITLPPGAATGDLLRWSGTVWETTETRFLEGNGRPDGQVAAPIGSRYIDKIGAQGAVEWVKRAGGSTNVGWICIAGDTGVRDISALIDKGNGIVNTAYVSRVGSVVDMFLDITMPSNKASNWVLFESLPGFSPGYYRYAALQDNSEAASSGGSAVHSDGGVTLYGIIGGKRDRFSGTWSTRDPWPAILPGVAG